MRWAAIALIVLGLLAACASPTAAPVATPPAPETTPTPVVAALAQPPVDLSATLNQLVKDATDEGVTRVGLVIQDDSGKLALRVNPGDPFVSASLYKLFVLWQVQVEIRSGRLSETTELTLSPEVDDSVEDGYSLGEYGDTLTVAEARRLMITLSNNTASWLLAQRIGWDTIEETLRDHEFHGSDVMPQQVTTAQDVVRFFEQLTQQTLDSRLATRDYDLMLDLLKAQEVNTYLSPGFPTGSVFAHKTGALDDVTHDAGVLFLPDGRKVYVAVLTEGDHDAGRSFMRQVAQRLWQTIG